MLISELMPATELVFVCLPLTESYAGGPQIHNGNRCHRIRAPGKISSPGGSGLRILPPSGVSIHL